MEGQGRGAGEVDLLEPGLDLSALGVGDRVDWGVVGDVDGRLGLDHGDGQDEDGEGGSDELDHCVGRVECVQVCLVCVEGRKLDSLKERNGPKSGVIGRNERVSECCMWSVEVDGKKA